RELKQLQDDVSPFPFERVEEVLEHELDLSIERAFLEFDTTPLAAASIGQVHRARLPNGTDAVVKVQRPDAPQKIEADLELLYQAAKIVRERVKALRFIDTVGLVDEFARSIRSELDYGREAANAERFKRNFAGSTKVRVPSVYRPYSTRRVLTLDYLDGTELSRLEVDGWTMEQRRTLAYDMAEAWMEMIFRHGFFHGDPHPANIICLADGPIGLIDFGQAGRFSDDDLSRLTALFIDAVNENVEMLPRRLADLGVSFPRGREREFVSELGEIYDRYYGVSLGDIDPLQLVREGFALIYRMNLELPTRFVLLDKAIATVGAVGVELYPQFNVFDVARPYAKELVRDRFSPQRVARRVSREARSYGNILSEAPHQVHDVLEELRDGKVEIGFRHEGLDNLAHRLDLVFNRLVVAVIAVGGIVGSAILGIFGDSGPQVLGIHVIAMAGFCLSALLGMWIAWAVLRSGRL
ncbi:MAG: ABC1 kinase family protein, partial [Gaiellaceae bacterium]